MKQCPDIHKSSPQIKRSKLTKFKEALEVLGRTKYTQSIVLRPSVLERPFKVQCADMHMHTFDYAKPRFSRRKKNQKDQRLVVIATVVEAVFAGDLCHGENMSTYAVLSFLLKNAINHYA